MTFLGIPATRFQSSSSYLSRNRILFLEDNANSQEYNAAAQAEYLKVNILHMQNLIFLIMMHSTVLPLLDVYDSNLTLLKIKHGNGIYDE